jgi:hypothetical protein
MNMAALPLVGLFAAIITTALLAPSVEAQQNACPPEVAQAQAALKGAQASLQGRQITRSLTGARTQEVNAPRTQEVNAPAHLQW